MARVLVSSNDEECFVGNETMGEPEILRLRARRYEEEIEEAEAGDEVGSSPSGGSPASTAKTYLVDEGEKMSPSGLRSRGDD